MKVYLKIEDKNGLKSELEIDNPDDALKVLLVQNVFNLFGSNVDMSSILDLLSRTGTAYKNLFEQLENEKEKTVAEIKPEEVREQMIQGYAEDNEIEEMVIEINPEEIKQAILNNEANTINDGLNSDDDYNVTGIKIRNGMKVYKLRYECICGHKGNHVVPLDAQGVSCHRCSKEMKVKFAHPDSTPDNILRDTFGNFLRSGRFRDKYIWKD